MTDRIWTAYCPHPKCQQDTIPSDDGRCPWCETVIVRDGKALYQPRDLMADLTPAVNLGVKLCECGCGQPALVARWNNPSKGHVKGEPVRFISGHNRRVAA
jgi:hypothetical protein